MGCWLFLESHKDYTIIAHNMKGYDGYFLMDHLIRNGIKHRVIYDGSKIMYINVHNNLNMRVIDSLNFLPMALGGI